MGELTEVLRILVTPEFKKQLEDESEARMISVSAFVRLALAQHIGMIEPPSVLIDTREPYSTKEAT